MSDLSQPQNPFALMIDPRAVFAQIERSERLERLSRRICRPLDMPVQAGATAADELECDGEDAQLAQPAAEPEAARHGLAGD